MTAPIRPEPLQVALLAGGRSSRMGRDKRFLEWNGVALIDHMRSIASAVGGVEPEHVFLCGDVPGRTCLKDETPGLGPLSGVLSAVIRALEIHPGSAPVLLILPVDMPRLRPELLERLAASLSSRPAATAVHYAGFELPCALRCTPEAEEKLRRAGIAPEKGSRSLRRFLAQLEAATLELPEAWTSQLLNLNSPADLEVARLEPFP